MILEELDLQAEARYQELFRSQARRDRQPVSAPRVHYDCSSREVLVSDYVRGVWLQDLIRAKETRDDATLAYLATLQTRRGGSVMPHRPRRVGSRHGTTEQ